MGRPRASPRIGSRASDWFAHFPEPGGWSACRRNPSGTRKATFDASRRGADALARSRLAHGGPSHAHRLDVRRCCTTPASPACTARGTRRRRAHRPPGHTKPWAANCGALRKSIAAPRTGRARRAASSRSTWATCRSAPTARCAGSRVAAASRDDRRLAAVIRADLGGRPIFSEPPPAYHDTLSARRPIPGVRDTAPRPILLGRHLLERGCARTGVGAGAPRRVRSAARRRSSDLDGASRGWTSTGLAAQHGGPGGAGASSEQHAPQQQAREGEGADHDAGDVHERRGRMAPRRSRGREPDAQQRPGGGDDHGGRTTPEGSDKCGMEGQWNWITGSPRNGQNSQMVEA